MLDEIKGPYFDGFFTVNGEDVSKDVYNFHIVNSIPRRIYGQAWVDFDSSPTLFDSLDFLLNIVVSEGEHYSDAVVWIMKVKVIELESIHNCFGDRDIFNFTLEEVLA